MDSKPISPRNHLLLDYALVGAMATLPSLLRMSNKVRCIYAMEALILLPYIAVTRKPGQAEGLLPFKVHQKVDPVNVAAFALQTLAKPFRKQRKASAFNLAFTAIAGLAVLLTDFSGGDDD